MDMRLLILLVLTLTLCELVMHSDAICPKGKKVSRNGGCEDCRDGTFQPEENPSKQCKACRRCDTESGSVSTEDCTKVRNTKCKCHGGFTPLDSDFSTCECRAGFGLNNDTIECLECGHGYFSTSVNSPCRKWKECKSGVNRTGTTTRDVICNNELQANTYVTTPPTPSKIYSLITSLKSHHPHEGAQTQKMHTSKTTTSTPGPPVTPKNKGQPSYPSNTANQIGLAILIFGIVGLLVLTAVTCKLHITPYMERKPAVQKNESVCRRPVEEIGDSMSSLKQNPEEP